MPAGGWSLRLLPGGGITATGCNRNSYQVDSVLPICRKHFGTGRIESVYKEELFNGQPEIEETEPGSQLGKLHPATAF
jgi:hypothetical protein